MFGSLAIGFGHLLLDVVPLVHQARDGVPFLPQLATALQQFDGFAQVVERLTDIVQHLGDDVYVGLIAIGNLCNDRAADPHYWYAWNLEDPNIRGYDAIRRLFLIEIAKHADEFPRP